MDSEAVFLDANALIYFLDETAPQHAQTIASLQKLIDDRSELFTSHHVIEEVLFIVAKLTGDQHQVAIALKQIRKIPELALVEPDTDLEFATRYVKLWQSTKLGINDALLLQLMLDAGIKYLFSYDAVLLKQAKKFGISAAND